MNESLLKQDITFLEYPLWFQDSCMANEVEGGYQWQDREGFVYRAGYKPPVKIDQLFLLYLLLKSQSEEWKHTIELSRYEILKACGVGINNFWYQRLSESLDRWTHVVVKFEGTFYDGRNYQSLTFGIIESWSVEKESKKLTIRLSEEWLSYIEHSNFFKMLDFRQMIQLRSPLALRLYELLIKTFQGRNVWQIGAKKLASKIPMSEKYPAHIIPKVKAAVHRINERTDLQLSLEVKRPQRGKAILVFRKLESVQEKEEFVITDLSEAKQELRLELLALLPEQHRAKKTIIEAVEKALRREDGEYVRRNILYSNRYAKRNYRTYLIKALSKDWASDWWREQVEEQEHKTAQSKVTETEQSSSKKQMEEDLEQELASMTEQFLEYSTRQELTQIEQHLKAKIEQSTEIPEGEADYHFKWRLLGILQSGIQRYQVL